MPDISQLLRVYARERGVRLDIVEKDYALSYLLAAIAETPGLGEQVVLKGGTALKKNGLPGLSFFGRFGLFDASPWTLDEY